MVAIRTTKTLFLAVIFYCDPNLKSWTSFIWLIHLRDNLTDFFWQGRFFIVYQNNIYTPIEQNISSDKCSVRWSIDCIWVSLTNYQMFHYPFIITLNINFGKVNKRFCYFFKNFFAISIGEWKITKAPWANIHIVCVQTVTKEIYILLALILKKELERENNISIPNMKHSPEK